MRLFPLTLFFVALLLAAFVFELSLPLFCLTLVLMPLGIFCNQYLIYRGRHFKFAREEQDNLSALPNGEGIKELKLHQQRRQVF